MTNTQKTLRLKKNKDDTKDTKLKVKHILRKEDRNKTILKGKVKNGNQTLDSLWITLEMLKH